MPRKRILLILPVALHVRNFISSGLVDDLVKDGYDFDIVSNASLAGAGVNSVSIPTPTDAMELDRRVKMRHSFRDQSMAERSLSSATYRMKYRSVSWRSPRRWKLELWRNLSRFKSYEKEIRSAENLLPTFPELSQFLVDKKYSAVLISSVIADELAFVDLLHAARKTQIPILYFVASWDNLSSKGMFLCEPDHLLVWGERDQEMAVREHAIPRSKIHVVGPPHFDHYFSISPSRQERRSRLLSKLGVPEDTRLLLFAGTTARKLADEDQLVANLDRELSDPKWVGWKILYRPHPRTRMNLEAFSEKFTHVLVDPSYLKSVANGKEAFSMDRGELEDLAEVLSATQLLISCFSTLMVEGALHGIPAVTIAFSPKVGQSEAVAELAQHTHLQEVMKWPGIYRASHLSELLMRIRELRDDEVRTRLAPQLLESAKNIANNPIQSSVSRFREVLGSILEKR